jgi:protein SCO1/2
LLCFIVTLAGGARAQAAPVSDVSEMGVTERLGDSLPLDAAFVDHHGLDVRLGDYFTGERPAVLIFGYHTCPMLCSLVQNATIHALRGASLAVGRDYEVIVISIDPEDTRHTATKRRDVALATYNAGRSDHEVAGGVRDEGFHYLTGKEDAIRRTADAAGFHYRYDAAWKQYAHPAVIMLVTPVGRVARYLYGMEFEPKDIGYGLLEARAGRNVSTLDRILLYCMHYDPGSGKYVLVAARVMQVGGVLSLVLLGGLLGCLWKRERRVSSHGADGEGAGVDVSERPTPTTPPRRRGSVFRSGGRP